MTRFWVKCLKNHFVCIESENEGSLPNPKLYVVGDLKVLDEQELEPHIMYYKNKLEHGYGYYWKTIKTEDL